MSQLVCQPFLIWNISLCQMIHLGLSSTQWTKLWWSVWSILDILLKRVLTRFFMIISRATKVNSGFITVVHNGFYRTKKFTNVYTMFKSKDKEFVCAIICVKVGWYLGQSQKNPVSVSAMLTGKWPMTKKWPMLTGAPILYCNTRDGSYFLLNILNFSQCGLWTKYRV